VLSGARSVPGLAPGAQASGSVTVTIPSATPPGAYRLLACADATGAVVESAETNNCLASATTLTVALPDLVETSLSNPPGPFRPGASFPVSDSVLNSAPVATGKSSTTKYYLSADGVKNTGDKLLTGVRSVASLGAFATSSGSVSVTIPSTTLPGTYVLLACADDARAIPESNETNNCRASATAVTVTP
jgi:subtilase family serine protease